MSRGKWMFAKPKDAPDDTDIYRMVREIMHEFGLEAKVEVFYFAASTQYVARAVVPALSSKGEIVVQACQSVKNGDRRTSQQFIYACLLDVYMQLDSPLGAFQRSQNE